MSLSEKRFQFYSVVSCRITGMVSINTVVKTVKIFSIDAMSTKVKWAIHYVISSLCGVQRVQNGELLVSKISGQNMTSQPNLITGTSPYSENRYFDLRTTGKSPTLPSWTLCQYYLL